MIGFSDPVIPAKENFIKAKYVDLAFVLRPSGSSDLSLDDLNRQLYSCARTSHVETVLRLLACGADPNWVDIEKDGNSAMHVAAKEGQKLQVELLHLYGADPALPNAQGQTPSALARSEGHEALSNRIIELCFEVSDRFSLFLTGRRPDHTKDIHFMIPEVAGQNTMIDSLRQQRAILQRHSDAVFERLVQDVYDEVDRRVVAVEWGTAPPYHLGNHQHVAAFLPPNEKLTATRNQLRQKLAKFDNHAFSIFIIDILKEIRRRFLGEPIPVEPPVPTRTYLENAGLSVGADNGNQDYDEVADCLNRKSGASAGTRPSSSSKTNSNSKADERQSLDARNSSHRYQQHDTVSLDDYLELKEQLREAMARLNLVTTSSTEVIKAQRHLQRTVEELQDANQDLRREMHHIKEQNALTKRNPSPTTQVGALVYPRPGAVTGTRSAAESADEMSSPGMYRSPSTGLSPAAVTAAALNRYGRRHGSMSAATGPPASAAPPKGNQSTQGRPPNGRNGSAPPFELSGSESTQTVNSTGGLRGIFSEDVFPDNLIVETEYLTGAIKGLLSELQAEGVKANAAYHSDSINHHIQRIIRVIPPQQRTGSIEDSVRMMKSAMAHLSIQCQHHPLRSTDETCHAAYDVAKAAKQLLVHVHQREP
uniref:ANK_REP_REGION domain-containing protein n=1 Tax=Panagrellus redivivus TaxID=6233 RepID=A0A7E4VFA0_PANRE